MMNVAAPGKKRKLTDERIALPDRLDVLFVAGDRRSGAWLTSTLAADRAAEIAVDEARGWPQAARRLRERTYDALLLVHEPGAQAVDSLIAALRGGGAEEAVIVLGEQSDHEIAAEIFEAGADGYVCVHTAGARSLLWNIAVAVERRRLAAEVRTLRGERNRRLRADHLAADRVAQRRNALLRTLETEATAPAPRLHKTWRMSTWNCSARGL